MLDTHFRMKKVQMFYDVVSPYSWVGFELLQRYSRKWNFVLDLCPFFLGGIMKGSSNRPPGMNAAKAAYMGADLKRISAYYDIPLNIPSDPAEVMFNKGSLSAQRLLTAVKIHCPEYLVPVSRQLWLRIWSYDEDITTNDSLKLVSEKAGIPLKAINNLIDQVTTDSIIEELKRTTQEALDSGVKYCTSLRVQQIMHLGHLG
ncbi:glutathione S-transferase kappa 1-like isoform X2 [Halichondria panicea]|uniref:glutathione S-transferase kappa 1-like isoform X2 n=1 Tax=Halichondria panicea TaxID=6063 RepID=UPI00312B9A14